VIFHSYVSLPEGSFNAIVWCNSWRKMRWFSKTDPSVCWDHMSYFYSNWHRTVNWCKLVDVVAKNWQTILGIFLGILGQTHPRSRCHMADGELFSSVLSAESRKNAHHVEQERRKGLNHLYKKTIFMIHLEICWVTRSISRLSHCDVLAGDGGLCAIGVCGFGR